MDMATPTEVAPPLQLASQLHDELDSEDNYEAFEVYAPDAAEE